MDILGLFDFLLINNNKDSVELCINNQDSTLALFDKTLHTTINNIHYLTLEVENDSQE